MLAFDAEYRFPHPDLGRMSYIDWPRVAERFDGVIIAPYQWKHRLELMWYYGWDCASGCIWNARAVSCFEVAETVE
jgi:hypothetical protein